MRLRRSQSSAVALLSLISLAGCGSGDSVTNAGVEGTASSSAPAQWHVSVSRVKEYRSLREVVKDSAAVVQVTAQERVGEVPATKDGTGTLTSTLTRVTVDRVFFNRQPVPTELIMRQTGSTDYVVDGNAELLVLGETYVLFVTPFNSEPDRSDSTGQWITVGELAAFRKADGGFVSVATDRGPLPAKIDGADITFATPNAEKVTAQSHACRVKPRTSPGMGEYVDSWLPALREELRGRQAERAQVRTC